MPASPTGKSVDPENCRHSNRSEAWSQKTMQIGANTPMSPIDKTVYPENRGTLTGKRFGLKRQCKSQNNSGMALCQLPLYQNTSCWDTSGHTRLVLKSTLNPEHPQPHSRRIQRGQHQPKNRTHTTKATSDINAKKHLKHHYSTWLDPCVNHKQE